MSVAHNFVTHRDKVYKRYIKTSLGVLSGKRPDPSDLNRSVPFVLSTPESLVTVEKSPDGEYDVITGHAPTIDYEEEVLEVYSEDEDKIFRHFNRKSFEKGLLVEYTEEQEPISYENALTDEELEKIAFTKSLLQFKKRIQAITSEHTLERLEHILDKNDRPRSFTKAVKEQIQNGVTS
jgi:hypothetical protein